MRCPYPHSKSVCLKTGRMIHYLATKFRIPVVVPPLANFLTSSKKRANYTLLLSVDSGILANCLVTKSAFTSPLKWNPICFLPWEDVMKINEIILVICSESLRRKAHFK